MKKYFLALLLCFLIPSAQAHDMAGMVMKDAPSPVAGGSAIKGGYSLTDQDGKTVSDKSFKGRYQLIYFGFTFCPDECPVDLRKLIDALKASGIAPDKIAPIFITIDPERDTVPVVKKYVAMFSPALTGLTGTPAQIKDVEGHYKVYAAKTGTGSDYMMGHSAYFYLMGPDGTFVDVLDSHDKTSNLAAKLKTLVR